MYVYVCVWRRLLPCEMYLRCDGCSVYHDSNGAPIIPSIPRVLDLQVYSDHLDFDRPLVCAVFISVSYQATDANLPRTFEETSVLIRLAHKYHIQQAED